MFTGLIEGMGKLLSVRRAGLELRVEIGCTLPMAEVKEGDSIAINGVCLTVVEKSAAAFFAQVSAETVQKTTFSKMTPGASVNLERALAIGGRLDGHLVQGHVDTLGLVERVAPKGRSVEIWFRVPGAQGRYIIPKGSIAIDGVSLTVNQLRDSGDGTHFSINLIPHTQRKTTLADLAPGHSVNIETDLLGRYVERLLRAGGRGPDATVDAAYLHEKGFI